MEESGRFRSSLASVRDDKSIYVCYSFLHSKQSDSDCFQFGFLSISPEAEVSARLPARFETSLNGLFTRRYRYREGKAIKTTQIGKLKVKCLVVHVVARNVRVICQPQCRLIG